jgi:hypothetical protein
LHIFVSSLGYEEPSLGVSLNSSTGDLNSG